jgi:hypothetical protein
MLFEIDYIRFLKSKIFYLKKCKHAGLQNAPKRLKLNTRIFETAKFLLQTKFSKFFFQLLLRAFCHIAILHFFWNKIFYFVICQACLF